ncbi:MAG: protein kinase [Gemmatimonadaceae bacterium]
MPSPNKNRSGTQADSDQQVAPYNAENATLLDRIRLLLDGSFAVERELGRGGTAVVFLATETASSRCVAIKVLKAELSRAVGEARFRREIRIASELDHPNILPLLEVGTAGEQLYYTSPFVDGGTLKGRLLRQRQLPVRQAIDLARAVANALDYAHSRDIVHRDIKPANILLGSDRTVVADFGIARLITAESGDTLTDSGLVVGTPEYMSPEQASSARNVDGRCDVYALGCVVYEMLAGEPPFTGPTPQAIVARHCHEAPRSIRVIRRAIPVGVERAVERALSKVPADRFETAGAFVDALEAGLDTRTDLFGLARLGRRTRWAVGGALALAAAIATWMIVRVQHPALDQNRVVVFPLHDASSPADALGEEIATFIGYRLGETRPLTWRDGWELMDADLRVSRARMDAGRARALTRRDGAAFFIDGSIIRRADSVTIALRLTSVADDSVIRVEQRSAPIATASVHQLGLQVVQALLPDLVAPGGQIDRSSLSERHAEAVANFLQGERDYRRMRFRTALTHYHAALRDDSAFALAAMRGAYTASWLSELSLSADFVRTALRNSDELTPAQALVTRALGAYAGGSADSAIHYLRRALLADSSVHAAWTLLGETYLRLLSGEWAADSLARAALERARAGDPGFAPTLLLLEEVALRDGDIRRAERLSEELRVAGADTTHSAAREIMHQCVRRGPSSVDWAERARSNGMALISATKVLAGAAKQADCAIEGFLAILASPSSTAGSRYFAFVALHAQLEATARSSRSTSLLASRHIEDSNLHVPKLLAAVSGSAYQEHAKRFADSVATNYTASRTLTLWLLAQYEARRGNGVRLEQIFSLVRQRADSSAAPLDRRLALSVEAQVRALRGDTAGAISILQAMKPSSLRQGITWSLWESLGPERMLLARLQFARGDFEAARRTATFIDATEPMPYPFFLRESLTLRAQAADSLKSPALAEAYRERLHRLSRGGSL